MASAVPEMGAGLEFSQEAADLQHRPNDLHAAGATRLGVRKKSVT
jgi:hypothetical protein